MTSRAAKLSIHASLLAALAGAGLCCGCACGWERCPTSVQDVYPLGAVNRAHYQVMQTNGQAANFILHLNDFVGTTSELTPAGKDHVLEIAARAHSVPFPIVIERSENNSSPALDEQRRGSIVRVLMDLGIGDASQRTMVAPAYGKGLTGREAEHNAALFESEG
jgi:hypothetical protein